MSKNKMNLYRKYLGKTFIIRDCRWEPGKEYVGKIGKVTDVFTSWYNSALYYIKLDVAPNVVFTLRDLKEVI